VIASAGSAPGIAASAVVAKISTRLIVIVAKLAADHLSTQILLDRTVRTGPSQITETGVMLRRTQSVIGTQHWLLGAGGVCTVEFDWAATAGAVPVADPTGIELAWSIGDTMTVDTGRPVSLTHTTHIALGCTVYHATTVAATLSIPIANPTHIQARESVHDPRTIDTAHVGAATNTRTILGAVSVRYTGTIGTARIVATTHTTGIGTCIASRNAKTVDSPAHDGTFPLLFFLIRLLLLGCLLLCGLLPLPFQCFLLSALFRQLCLLGFSLLFFGTVLGFLLFAQKLLAGLVLAPTLFSPLPLPFLGRTLDFGFTLFFLLGSECFQMALFLFLLTLSSQLYS
jgi:hypothetical protein